MVTATPTTENNLSASEKLWTLLLLQNEAAQLRLREFHQQMELFILQTGVHPITGEGPLRVAHDPGTVPLRDRTAPASASPLPLVSEFVVQLTRQLCDNRASVRDPAAMAQLKASIEDAALTLDDRVQILFVLDRSFTLNAALHSAFEKDAGYTVLTNWFQLACTFTDEGNRALSHLLLQFLLRHKPALSFGRKTIVATLRQIQKQVSGRQNKALVKETIETYRTSNFHQQ